PDKAIDLLDEAAAALRISGGEQSMLPGSKMPVLTSAEIAKVVGKASGVPAERCQQRAGRGGVGWPAGAP
ncbi:MAG TPA: hypothetical protein DEW18_04375, partial [Ruminococcaceae bacterium]|nr:hypothetical protein [Oscillospiraceae bacterium]